MSEFSTIDFSHQSLDFPTKKDEHFKYTSMGNLKSKGFDIPSGVLSSLDIEKHGIEKANYAGVFVFLGGCFSHENSEVPKQIRIESSSPRKKENNVFIGSVNQLFSKENTRIVLKDNQSAEKPYLILHVLEENNQGACADIEIKLSENTNASFVQKVIYGENASNTYLNLSTYLDVETHAQVNFYNFETISAEGFLHQQLTADLSKASKCHIFSVSTGGAQIRSNINLKLNGENGFGQINGLQLASDSNHIDHHTKIEHLVPHCESSELYKLLAEKKGTCVFNGKVHVYKDAQKTNAYQSSAGIIMSDQATIYAKPELEIYADDVKCSHGCTTGALDKEALFYLRSRGLSEKEARKLLLEGFALEVFQGIDYKMVLDEFQSTADLFFNA